MNLIEAALLGCVQGFTEFLPISSSGHLVLAQRLLGLPEVGGVQFEVAVHLATCLAIATVYASDLARVVAELRFALKPRELARHYRERPMFRLGVLLLVSAIPVGVVGILAKDSLERIFHDVRLVSVCLIVTALILTLSRLAQRIERPREVSFGTTMAMGLAQAIAILPGISRSGSTITAGLLVGLPRSDAARFSFLMVLLPLLGASILELRHGLSDGPTLPSLIVGMVAAYVTGCVALKLLVRLVARGRIDWFAPYCAIVGVVGLIASFRS